jgi:hypothetical protein
VRKQKIMNAVKVRTDCNNPALHVKSLLELAIASPQGLTVSIDMVGRRRSGKDEALKGALVSINYIPRGKHNFLTFEVMHPVGTGGMRKTYEATTSETMVNLQKWAEGTTVEELSRAIKKGGKICPGITLDRPHG